MTALCWLLPCRVRSHWARWQEQQSLSRIYAAWNAKHFGGILPAVTVKLMGLDWELTGKARGDVVIKAWPDQRDEILVRISTVPGPFERMGTLLHEMVHVWQWRTHGTHGHDDIFYVKLKEIVKEMPEFTWLIVEARP